MPAATFDEVYQFAENMTAAQAAILLADIVTLIGDDTAADADNFLFGPRDQGGEDGDKPNDRIEFAASGFSQASDQQIQSSENSEYFFAHFAGQLSFTVITPRDSEEATAEHGKRVGRIIYLMQPRARRFTSDNLPLYEILALRLSGVPKTETDNETNTDRTEITFSVELWTLPTAFPAAIT